jgi:type 1 glutamine amidotransferase
VLRRGNWLVESAKSEVGDRLWLLSTLCSVATMNRSSFLHSLVLGAASLALSASAAEPVQPLKVLIVLGGCCHDYNTQKMLLAEGISARANVECTIEHNPDKTTKCSFEFYKSADWAKGYDVVLHDECAADVVEQGYVGNILNAHKAGVPAVNLHCAMHCYRWGNFKDRALKMGDDNAGWFEFTGVQSTGHGPQEPISVTFTDNQHPTTKGLADWTTIKEELYNNIQVFPTAHALAKGDQQVTDKKTQQKRTDTAVLAWTNEYGPNKTRVFNTTLGHNNETVSDARYLDFVTRGLLWAAGKLDAEGKPLPGYASKQK